ncbi:MAG: DUF1302 domain-containing protein [Desulfobacterales bacterium]|nr:DUF1302 domain-containing protein [Desulfobacterales bacterium]
MKKILYIVLFTCFLLLVSGNLFAEDTPKNEVITEDDDFSIDEDFEDDEDISSDENVDKGSEEKSIRIGGHLKLHTSYNFAHESTSEYDGLSSLKSEAMLEIDAKLFGNWKFYVNGSAFYDVAYDINGDNKYTDEVLDDYEDDGELKEAYISGSLTDWMDLKTGRQIVVWGKSDYIRVTDVLNPLNLQEPGLTDIKDLRLPVAMTKLGFFFGDFSLYAIAVHEHRYNKMPSYGSDFYMYPYNVPNEEFPENTLENNEYAFSLEGNFTGWDLAFYYFDGYDDTFYVESFIKKHARIKMYGATINAAFGNFLYKAESAYFEDLKYTNSTETYSRNDNLIGFEYSGITDTTVSLEVMNKFIIDFDDSIKTGGQDENIVQSVFRISRDFFNEKLNLAFIALTLGDGDEGAYQRFTAEYEWTDSIKLYGGVIFYKTGTNTMFSDIGNNDRFFLDITYTF